MTSAAVLGQVNLGKTTFPQMLMEDVMACRCFQIGGCVRKFTVLLKVDLCYVLIADLCCIWIVSIHEFLLILRPRELYWSILGNCQYYLSLVGEGYTTPFQISCVSLVHPSRPEYLDIQVGFLRSPV